jgi:hypothetical protein
MNAIVFSERVDRTAKQHIFILVIIGLALPIWFHFLGASAFWMSVISLFVLGIWIAILPTMCRLATLARDVTLKIGPDGDFLEYASPDPHFGESWRVRLAEVDHIEVRHDDSVRVCLVMRDGARREIGVNTQFDLLDIAKRIREATGLEVFCLDVRPGFPGRGDRVEVTKMK